MRKNVANGRKNGHYISPCKPSVLALVTLAEPIVHICAIASDPHGVPLEIAHSTEGGEMKHCHGKVAR